MPRRSIWKGSFVDAFLLRMKKKRDPLLNKKIWSRRSSILPEFTMEKLLFVVRSLKERLVINLESLLRHGNKDFQEQILDWEKKGDKVKSKSIWHEKEIRYRISYSLFLFSNQVSSKMRYMILSESDEPPLAFPFRDSDSERESVHS